MADETNSGADLIEALQAFPHAISSDNSLTLQSATIFVFSVMLFFATAQMSSRSVSIYRFVLSTLELKAEKFFEAYGVEQDIYRVGWIRRAFLRRPRLHEIQNDDAAGLWGAISFLFVTLAGVMSMALWASLQLLQARLAVSEADAFQDIGAEFWIAFGVSIANGLVLIASAVFFALSALASVGMLVRYGTVTALYSSLSDGMPLRDSGLFTGVVMSVVSLAGSTASILGLVFFLMN